MGAPYHFGKIVRLDTIWTQNNRFPVRYGIGYLFYCFFIEFLSRNGLRLLKFVFGFKFHT